MASKTNSIHIGQAIKARARDLKIGPTELGELLNTSKQNVYGIFKRESVDTELLRRCSEVLNFNFFSLYTPGFTDEKRSRVQQLAEEIVKLTR